MNQTNIFAPQTRGNQTEFRLGNISVLYAIFRACLSNDYGKEITDEPGSGSRAYKKGIK
jgi:hypothetical protein